MSMANSVKALSDVTTGVVVADRPGRHADLVQDLPARSLRAHLSRLPEPAPAVIETPLIETDTAPGFSALRQIPVRRGPIAGIAVDARDGLVYTTNPTDNSVSVLDPATLSVVATIPGLDEASAVAAANGRAYVATVSLSHDAVTTVDPDATEPGADHPLALSVTDVAVDAAGRYVYVARTGRDGMDVAIIDTADGRVRTLDLGTRPGAAAAALTLSPDGARVYVATVDDLGGELVAIDTATRRIVGGLAFPAPLRAVTAGRGVVYVATCDLSFGGVIDVVDARTMRVVSSIDVGGLVTDLVAGAAGDRLYVAGVDRVSVVCVATHEIIDTVTIVEQPSCLAESADGRKLFIADYDGDVTALTVASSTESLLARMMAGGRDAVLDIPMLELEPVGV